MSKSRNRIMIISQKKGGPYPKSEQKRRVEEVYKLHFDYGYSRRKIADFLNINRGTINRDVMSLYNDIGTRRKDFDAESSVIKSIERFEIQRRRLRRELDNVESVKERIIIGKFIFDIDSKIANFEIRIAEAKKNIVSLAADLANKKMEQLKKNKRFVPRDIFWQVSTKARDKIMKIYNEDMKNMNL